MTVSLPSPLASSRTRWLRRLSAGSWGLLLALGITPAALAESAESPEPAEPAAAPIRQSLSCNLPLPTLSDALVRDLPGYANRVAQRSSGTLADGRRPTYMIVASQPNTTPLPLTPGSDTATPADDSLQQVFITTLERQYTRPRLGDERSLESQHYHWLFFAENADGWYLAFAYSRFGEEDENAPTTPPRDSTIGILGQAVTLWLRDCRAGAVGVK